MGLKEIVQHLTGKKRAILSDPEPGQVKKLPPPHLNKFTIEFEGETYQFHGPGSQQDFEKWMNTYTANVPRCSTCRKVIFPQEAVGTNGSNFMHGTWDCCPSDALIAGYFNQDGEFKPLFPDGGNIASASLNPGINAIIING